MALARASIVSHTDLRTEPKRFDLVQTRCEGGDVSNRAEWIITRPELMLPHGNEAKNALRSQKTMRGSIYYLAVYYRKNQEFRLEARQ